MNNLDFRLLFTNRFLKKVQGLLAKNDRGSFTLEASLVFPIVFLATLAVLFLALFVFQQGMLYYKSTMAAERATFAWNNSHREADTGDLHGNIRHNFDGLYWRLNDGNVSKKIANARNTVLLSDSDRWQEAGYNRSLVGQRTINIGMQSQLYIPAFLKDMFGMQDLAEAAVSSEVSEPAEFIRNVEFFYYYLPTKVK